MPVSLLCLQSICSSTTACRKQIDREREREREREGVSLVGVTPLWMGKGSGLFYSELGALLSDLVVLPHNSPSTDADQWCKATISVGSAVPHPYQRVNHGSYQAMHAYMDKLSACWPHASLSVSHTHAHNLVTVTAIVYVP